MRWHNGRQPFLRQHGTQRRGRYSADGDAVDLVSRYAACHSFMRGLKYATSNSWLKAINDQMAVDVSETFLGKPVLGIAPNACIWMLLKTDELGLMSGSSWSGR